MINVFSKFTNRYSAIGYCMVVSALCAQFSYAFRIVFDGDHPHVELEQLMEGLFCAGAVMISYGAVRARSIRSGIYRLYAARFAQAERCVVSSVRNLAFLIIEFKRVMSPRT